MEVEAFGIIALQLFATYRADANSDVFKVTSGRLAMARSEFTQPVDGPTVPDTQVASACMRRVDRSSIDQDDRSEKA
eukprot:14847826-Alexandrium_andersonii.AAC.1